MRPLALLVLLCALSPAPAAVAAPNFLFVVTDDMRRDDLEAMPLLKELVIDRGVSFSQAFVNVPLCCPSRATILRGQYSHNTKVLTNAAPSGGYERFRGLERSTIATALAEAGYRTGLFGKYLNGYPAKGEPFSRDFPAGWHTWRVPISGDPYSGFNYSMWDEVVFGPTTYLLAVPFRNEPASYVTDVLVRETGEFIDAAVADGVPFFAMLSTYAPHGPAVPAPRHRTLQPDRLAPRGPAFGETDVSDKPRYVSRLRPLKRNALRGIESRQRQRFRSLQAVDEGIAALIERMGRLGVLDDTYVVFTSDNGWIQGEHRLKQGKSVPYEESIGVPLVVRGPFVPRGAQTDALALNTDFAPTFAELAGATFEHSVDGRSLARILSAPDDLRGWRQSVLLDSWPGKSAPGNTHAVFHALRSRDYLYVEYKRERELYDMVADPHQLDNAIGGADSEIVSALAERLAALRACVGPTCRTLEDLPVPGARPEEPKPKP